MLSKYRSIYNSYLTNIIFAEDDAAFETAVQAFCTAMDDIGIATLEAHYTQAHQAAAK